MPNPKVGTVSPIRAKRSRMPSRASALPTDKAGIIHCTIGKASFDDEALKSNLQASVCWIWSRPSRHLQGYLPAESVGQLDHGVRRDVDQSSLSLK
uniref:hypothetical protein n=1 Tax=Massilia oculi TaxID=945844 RepID=UPI0036D21712